MRHRTTGKYKNPIIITLYVEKEDIELIDDYCHNIKKSRSRFLIDTAKKIINENER